MSFLNDRCVDCRTNWAMLGLLGGLAGVLALGFASGTSGVEVAKAAFGAGRASSFHVVSKAAAEAIGPLDEAGSKVGFPTEARPEVRPARPAADPQRLAAQLAAYDSTAPKSILELQPFRSESSIEIQSGGERRGRATLVNLNPDVNVSYLLRLRWQDDPEERAYHLENRDPRATELLLEPHYRHGLVVVERGQRQDCPLWSPQSPRQVEAAATAHRTYVLLCNGTVRLRGETAGHRTAKEWAAEFLRDNVWLGDEMTDFVKTRFFGDAYLSLPVRRAVHGHPAAGEAPADGPAPAPVHCSGAGECLKATEVGIRLESPGPGGISVGRWHGVAAGRGIYVAAIQPKLVPPEILSHPERLGKLDEVEARALAYLVAFDLGQFDLRFALGTDHPRLGWSTRVPDRVRSAGLPGPDGVGTPAPLVSTGMIPPDLRRKVAATFTAGFKREHGAFRWAELSTANGGSHYGFIENGVVFSKLQPGLATLVVSVEGTVQMKTWTEADDARLREIRYARQNGVPILERDPETGRGVPGRLVNQWAAGNWSGSQDRRFRALRAGLCLHERGDRRFLIYGYFSSATPAAMARVFQAYNCSYAMHLDMNALEHTYLALYNTGPGGVETEHLVEGMQVVDKRLGDTRVPRFVGYADNRDFFYLLRRDADRSTGG